MKILCASVLLALAASLPAQNLIETFSYPNGTTIPNWTVRSGSWKINNGRLIPTGGRTTHFITNNIVPVTADTVVDVEVIYPTVTSLHFGGLVVRHPGAGSGTVTYMKIQDNSSAGTGAFNRAFLYGVTSSTYLDIVPPTKHAICRLFAQGSNAWFEIDSDLDGIFETVSPVRTLTPVQGLAGISGYNAPEMDNWKFYKGAMTVDASTPKAKLGTVYKMNFSAPQNGGSTPLPTPWIGLLSTGTKGIPLPGGTTIPLTFDALLVQSLSFGWNGALTTKAPTAQLPLAIPSNPSLKGLKLFAAAITLDPSQKGGFGAVSNAHGFIVE